MRKVDKKLLKSYHKLKCIVCKVGQAEAHHVKSKKSGGDDVEYNLIPLCRKCHSEVHSIGLNRFSDKHSSVKGWLLKNGWELNVVAMKWYRPKGGVIE
jgi:5-methylcytosine-specific restriction endonuclease McrA